MMEYRISGVTLTPPVKDEKTLLLKKTAVRLGVEPRELEGLRILRRSVDARKKPQVIWNYTLAFRLKKESRKIKDLLRKKILISREPVVFPEVPVVSGAVSEEKRPVVIGSGPAGLFCTYFLAQAGLRPILLERGRDMVQRTADVEAFWQGGPLQEESNVQYGEGGAGTFSDGKLYNHGLKEGSEGDRVLHIFAEHGAPEDILYSAHPHIGTDVLKNVVVNMRKSIQELGGEVFFESRFEEPVIREQALCAIRYSQKGIMQERRSDCLVLCIGHSARDTYRSLHLAGVIMEPKAFAVGLRMIHPQDLINRAQYGDGYETKELPAAEYKLTARTKDGRGVYSFCMCPGGTVVNASSEKGHLAVNGMSYRARDLSCANSAIVVTVDGALYGKELFDGMEFQRALEKKAFDLAQGNIPVECLQDYLEGTGGELRRGIDPGIRGAYAYAPVHELLPREICRDICEAMPVFDRKVKGFAMPEAVFAGVESRTSSPLRILRDESGQSNIRGIYPVGEGAGYAGGITSAAADGIRAAFRILQSYE